PAVLSRALPLQRIRTAIRSRRDVQILATLCISVAIACTPGVTRTLRYIDYCIRAVVYREVQRQRIRTAIRSRRDVKTVATLCISVAFACTPGVTRTLRYIDYCIRAVVYREVQRQRIRTAIHTP